MQGLCWKKPMLDFIKKSQYVTPIFSTQSFGTFNKQVMRKSHSINKWKKRTRNWQGKKNSNKFGIFRTKYTRIRKNYRLLL